MRIPRGAFLLGTGLVSGLLVFSLTETFHWAYLAALGSMLGLFTSGQAIGSASTPRPADGRASDGTTMGRNTPLEGQPRSARLEALRSSASSR